MNDWSSWTPRERAVLVFVKEADQLLLIHKKRGLGAGKVSSPGGRVEPGETWDQAAHRELREETGLSVNDLSHKADLWFQFTSGYSMAVRVFLGGGWSGTLTACEEADPFWHPAAQIPWDQMWADDALWLPPVLAGRQVTGRFVFDGDRMQEATVHILERPPSPFNG
jgi:8-oxo-dGTP diphosphatase